MGISCTLVALSKDDVEQDSIKGEERLRLGPTWDVLEKLLTFEAPRGPRVSPPSKWRF